MVVISAVPALSVNVIQERAGAPSICTAHAPHRGDTAAELGSGHAQQVPEHQSGGVSPSKSTLWVYALTLI
jgi:hypothetical protein